MASTTPALRPRRLPAKRSIVISQTEETQQWGGDSYWNQDHSPASIGASPDGSSAEESTREQEQAEDIENLSKQQVSPSTNNLPTSTTTKTTTTTLTATTTIVVPHRHVEADGLLSVTRRTSTLSGGDDEEEDYGLETPQSSLVYPSSSPVRKFQTTLCDLFQAGLVGALCGFCVAIFKLSIEAVQGVSYKNERFPPLMEACIPGVGGLLVGLLLWAGGGSFPPGLKGIVQEVVTTSARGAENDDCEADTNNSANKTEWFHVQLHNLRKLLAAVFTLGSGCSLGPEGPCVELGMMVARACMVLQPRRGRASQDESWDRLLLSCGAAAGVAAGFNAPIGGVFFALEVMQTVFEGVLQEQRDALERTIVTGMISTAANVTPVLIASVLSALVSRAILGNHLVLNLTKYSLETPLVELPLYLLLGVCSGVVAFCFRCAVHWSQSFFSGNLGYAPVRSTMRAIPNSMKPMIGGLCCGCVGLKYPQILFYGYETLNDLLANNTLPTTLLLSLLFLKTLMTALSAGSGLIGGTFAPSLFLGAMLGGAFHNVMTSALNFGVAPFYQPTPQLADVPAYAMVGAACVLAAFFRAPLTATLLLFELTHDYDVILPLMASAGIGSCVADILDHKASTRRRDSDSISWNSLADRIQAKAQTYYENRIVRADSQSSSRQIQ